MNVINSSLTTGLAVLNGLAIVDGPESTWTLPSNQIQIGRETDGRLEILNGAEVVSSNAGSPTSSSGIIGVSDLFDVVPFAGEAHVWGPGSRWVQDGVMNADFRGP